MNVNVKADVYVGQVIGVNHEDSPMGWLVDEQRAARVQMCLDYIVRRVNEFKALYEGATITVEAESHSDPGGIGGRDDWWGTVDVTITVRNSHTGECLFIEVCDYKDGRGYVTVKDNTQLLSYVIGKLRPYIASGPEKVRPLKTQNVTGCRISIVQPKTNPVVRYEDLSTHAVVEEYEKLIRAAHATDAPDAPLFPGKHCQWCKANPKRGGHCTAQAEQSLETVKVMNTEVITTDDGQDLFEYIGKIITDPTALSSDELAKIADARKPLEAAFDKVDQELVRRIETGIKVNGDARRPGRGSRVWNEDEETIAKALKGRRMKKDQIYPAKLLSPAQLEKVECLTEDQKSKLLAQFVSEKSGKLKLTKVSRDESAEEMFKDVVQSDTNDVESIFDEPDVNFF
jgi:hypothetical protein